MIEAKGQNVIIEIITRVDDFASGIKKRTGLLVATSNMKQAEPNQGIIYAISAEIDNPEYAVGDTVVFHTREIFQGFDWEGRKLVSIQNDEIQARIADSSS